MQRFFCLLALAICPWLRAQAPPWEVGLLYVPTTTTTLVKQTVHVAQMTLVNRTASAVVVTVADLSSNCNGSPCSLFSASIPANTTYTIALGGVRATSGVSWVADTNNAISGWIKGSF